MLIEGNDLRGINVALISKFPFEHVMTNRQVTNDQNQKIFSRDCLQVKFHQYDPPLYLYVNHFKSMMGGRPNTQQKRIQQTKQVLEIIEKHHGPLDKLSDRVIVLGDFNDYVEGSDDRGSGITPLVYNPAFENVLATRGLPEEEQ